MTSDAKIGLLLGLVFIFIIAFVINGLPRFRNAMDSNEPAIVVQGDPIGYRERNTEGVFEATVVEEQSASTAPNDNDGTENTGYRTPWSDEHSVAQGSHVDEVADSQNNNESEQYSDYPPLAENSNNIGQDSLVGSNSQDFERFRMNLPTTVSEQGDVSITQLSSNTQEQQSTILSGGRQGFSFLGGQNRAANPWGQRRGQMPQQGGQQQIQQASLPVQTENTARQIQTTLPAQTNQTTQQKTYIVQEGDNNLARIARKFYGEKEGNRLVNINRIYEANKKVLKSPDKIFIGQTIVIPQPAPPVVDSTQPANVLNGGIFQTVPSIGGDSRQNQVKIQDTGRWYVVKEDDSLWKIATEQLGKGTRFEEINKLNADILSNGTKLKPGMKLRLPAQ